jgi:hypothetical protein
MRASRWRRCCSRTRLEGRARMRRAPRSATSSGSSIERSHIAHYTVDASRPFAAQLGTNLSRALGRQGDNVATHGLVEFSNDDERGTVAADLFRLEDGKIAEQGTCCTRSPKRARTRSRASEVVRSIDRPQLGLGSRWPPPRPAPGRPRRWTRRPCAQAAPRALRRTVQAAGSPGEQRHRCSGARGARFVAIHASRPGYRCLRGRTSRYDCGFRSRR